MMEFNVRGHRRQQGFGIRNYVTVISTVQCANTAARQIASSAGVPCITHEFGCIESAPHHRRTCLGLTAAGTHPNVYGTLIVGLGCEQTDASMIVETIRKSGREAEYVGIQESGSMSEAVKRGADSVARMKYKASCCLAENISHAGLIIGVQCGGSDWTTAIAGNTVVGSMADLIVTAGGTVIMSEVEGLPGSEHIVAAQAASPEVSDGILRMVQELREDFLAKTGSSIESVNPTPGNKAGGITTLVEKSIGNIKKMGTTPVQGILKIGEIPPGPGLYILDNRCPGPDSFNMTGFAMAHAHAAVFSTGRGTPVGNAIMPVIKLTGNSESYVRMKDMIDFDASTVLSIESIESAGRRLFSLLSAVASGQATASERNGNTEYTIPHE